MAPDTDVDDPRPPEEPLSDTEADTSVEERDDGLSDTEADLSEFLGSDDSAGDRFTLDQRESPPDQGESPP
jgi:hypothetical protein